MTKVSIAQSVTQIGDYAFEWCGYMQNITLPDGLESIGASAFAECVNLRSIRIPNGVTRIGKSAFWNCSSLSSVTLPEGITQIEQGVFSRCKIKSIVIPDHVTSIGSQAFELCTNLESVNIPSKVESIGMYAFSACFPLTEITIPSSVISVEYHAFSSCSKLKRVYYPDGLDLSKAGITASAELIVRGHIDSKKKPVTSPSIESGSLTQPPLLALVDGSLKFSDANGNNRIDADEKCTVKFKVVNNGKGAATNCEARVKLSGATSGITVKTVKLPTIAAGNNYEVSVPVTSSVNTQDGQVSFAIEVYEPQGWGIAPFTMSVATKAYDPPYLQVVDYNIASNSGKIRKMEPFTLSFNLQNTKYGNAENVKVSVKLPANVFVMDGSAELLYPLIKSGEVKSVKVTLAANNNYATTNIPITIDVKEKHGKFAENKQLDIALNQTTSSSINIAAKDEPQQERKEIKLAMMTSEVDRNIPVAKSKNQNTFVLIIANEHYQQVASVPFALNDGNIFREYCIKTLGIGEKHIKYLADATGNQIKAGVNWLNNVVETFDEPQIIVYYAGHGIPDESSKSAYLLPIDGSGTDVTTGYKLDDLYATLGNMPASRIAVFMDACFSGSKREQGMLASARGVALKAKSGVPQGNMVVFSAAQGDETAYPNREQQHGLFTYYLLKKLQDTEGNVTLKDLGDYVTKQVSQQSLLLNDKRQTPSVIPSTSLGSEWQSWKLK